MSNSAAFKRTFQPYCGKYAIQGKGELFDEPLWSTRKERLTAAIIEQAISQRLVIAFFQSYTPQFLGIDIDDHSGRGEAYLLNLYNQSVNRFGCKPSLLARSPHGLHAYWILSERMSGDVLENLARVKLKGIPIEIKPTASTALRIPAESQMIDPDNLQLLNISFEIWADQVKAYHPAILFDDNYLPKTLRDTLTERKTNYRKLRALPKIEQIEADLLPLQNGNTNDKFLQLCNVYRCAGLSVEDAVYRFQLCFIQSPGYTGDLLKVRRLTSRITNEFKNNQYEYVPKKHDIQLDMQYEILAADIADLFIDNKIFAVQRRKPIERFISKILLWADWHDQIFQDHKQTAAFDFLYPYYRRNRREDYYPLPKTFLRRANKRYNELMPYLQSIGFVKPDNRPYVPDAGICRYYRIDKGFNISQENTGVVKYVAPLLQKGTL